MKVKLHYRVTEAYQQTHLISTGERYPSNPTLEVELTELTPAQREIIVSCGLDSGNAVSIPVIITGVELKGYDAPKFTTVYENGVKFDEPPTVEQWLALADERLRIREKFQPILDAAIAEKKAKEQAKKDRIATLYAEYKELQDKWLPRIKDMTEDEANQPLPENIRAIEVELASLGESSIWNKLSAEKTSRWERLHDERIKAEAEASKRTWIEAHGSDQLRRGYSREHTCTRLYVIERAAMEAPDFTVDFYDGAEWKDRSCPSVVALNEAEAAEKLNIGDVQIVWLTEPAKNIKHTGDEYGYYDNPFQACEAVVIRRYLGKYDLVKTL